MIRIHAEAIVARLSDDAPVIRIEPVQPFDQPNCVLIGVDVCPVDMLLPAEVIQPDVTLVAHVSPSTPELPTAQIGAGHRQAVMPEMVVGLEIGDGDSLQRLDRVEVRAGRLVAWDIGSVDQAGQQDFFMVNVNAIARLFNVQC